MWSENFILYPLMHVPSPTIHVKHNTLIPALPWNDFNSSLWKKLVMENSAEPAVSSTQGPLGDETLLSFTAKFAFVFISWHLVVND